jgi:uncharacterized protein YgbK (DUF1537 family)
MTPPTRGTETWLIIADDVTGALDSAVGFAGSGRVEYGSVLPAVPDVAAISTGSRAAAVDRYDIGEHVDRTQVDRLFVKIDSTLRGRPAEHLRSAMDWWEHPATTVICPASPTLGRTVSGGRVFVAGEPASSSAAGSDPVAPTRQDDLTLVFGAPLVDVGDLPDVVGRERAVIVDAVTSEDLADIAAAVIAAGSDAVAVGSSGLAAAIGARRGAHGAHPPRATRVVVVVTSVHPVSRAQVAALGDGYCVVSPPTLTTAAVPHDQAVTIATETARRAALLIGTQPGTAVVVVGGDGTDALLAALQADGVDVLGSLMPGVPWGRISGGPAADMTIVTKSGGFGDADTLAHIIHMLTDDRQGTP